MPKTSAQATGSKQQQRLPTASATGHGGRAGGQACALAPVQSHQKSAQIEGAEMLDPNGSGSMYKLQQP
jgi:hypothetical protein